MPDSATIERRSRLWKPRVFPDLASEQVPQVQCPHRTMCSTRTCIKDRLIAALCFLPLPKPSGSYAIPAGELLVQLRKLRRAHALLRFERRLQLEWQVIWRDEGVQW